MEIAPGVHQISGSRASHCFLITEPVLTLVDSGMPGQTWNIVAYLADIQRSVNDVHRLILTHADIDHIGSAQDLRRITGMDVYLHPLDAPYALGQKRPKPVVKAFFDLLFRRRMRHGPPEPTLPLDDGQMIDDIEVIHTPGHTAGHVSLLRDGVLFAGDLLMTGEKFRLPPRMLNDDTDAVRESARKLLRYDFHTAVSGHGAPAPDARAKLEELVSSF